MKSQHEKLLVATLAGLVIMSAAAFAVSPVMAAEHQVEQRPQVIGKA